MVSICKASSKWLTSAGWVDEGVGGVENDTKLTDKMDKVNREGPAFCRNTSCEQLLVIETERLKVPKDGVL